MKAYSTIVALALVTATGSFAPAFARPFLYVSGFSYSGSGEACLKGAQKALEAADFKRDIKTDKFDGDAAEQGGFVYGYLKKNPIVVFAKSIFSIIQGKWETVFPQINAGVNNDKQAE